MYKKILVPLDGSELAEAVLPQARMLAECGAAEIVLLRVTSYPVYDTMPADAGLVESMIEAIRNEAQQYLDRMAADLKQLGVTASAVVREGAVADNILDYAHRNGVDLIAMSTHGRSGLGRWLIGSVADRVVHGAQVPVLLVRPVEIKK